MFRKILVIVIAILALLGGATAGDLLREKLHPEAPPQAEAAEGTEATGTAEGASGQNHAPAKDHGESTEISYFRFPNQFFIPVMQNGNAIATMILTLSLEIPATASEATAAREHKLRDVLLRALMIHANTGGFGGNYTADPQMETLRQALLKAAQGVEGTEIRAVLIEDIARQMS